MTVNFRELVLKLDETSKINQALIQRCVDKGLFDENFLKRSIDMEVMELGRRIFNQSESFIDDEEEEGIVLGFGKNHGRKPAEIGEIGNIKERDLYYTLDCKEVIFCCLYIVNSDEGY